jgi:glycosidase
MKHLLLFLSLALVQITTAQVTTNPIFATQTDQVTITFDASQGNGALAGLPAGTVVYAHTGVITQTGGAGNWQYVVGNWGTADARVAMTRVGTSDLYTLTYSPTLFDWYDSNNNDNTIIPGGTVITGLAFVFRNQAGSLVGRAAGGGDIFIPIYTSSSNLLATIVSPASNGFIASVGSTINVEGATSVSANLQLFDNGALIASGTGTSLQHTIIVTAPGDHVVRFEAANGPSTAADSFVYVVNPTVNVQDPPAGTLDGINYLSPTSVVLRLFAPNKQYVYLLSDLSDWLPSTQYFMNRSTDGNTWWIQLNNLSPGQYYRFQYYVDGQIKVADPYCELVLDPWNDPFITPATFPNMPTYPANLTQGIVGVFQTAQSPYNWQTTSFTPPSKTDAIYYELHLRDFLGTHSYVTLKDTLDYLENLGVNVIKLMPVQEFEGNISWGYNPSFHMALDKYYGTKNQLKAFIDECHSRGIAVVLDVVYNHVFGQSPLAQLYWDAANNRPAADNPWVNPIERHPFNVGYDVNHESQATRNWVDRVMRHWITEFRVDGFRFDLSKGFTQTNSGSNVGQWGQYDLSRINNLKRIADVCWAADADFYVILEHFADNNEERELSNYGMMLWGKATDPYNEGTMGYPNNSNFGYAMSYQSRTWSNPHLVGYMESHDEERLMYKNLTFGATQGGYNVRDLATALRRQELAANFFFPIPGPKMIWQFGELGYDVSINYCQNGTINTNCRTDPKPIRWNYFTQANRRRLYDVYAALAKLRVDEPAFETTNFQLQPAGAQKAIRLNHNSMNVIVVGNFGMTAGDNSPVFQHNGWWYEFWSGDSLNVTDVNQAINLQAGEYRLYTDVRLQVPPVFNNLSQITPAIEGLQVFPNPTEGELNIRYTLEQGGQTQVEVIDMQGRVLARIFEGEQFSGAQWLSWDLGNSLPAGMYMLRVSNQKQVLSTRFVVQGQ